MPTRAETEIAKSLTLSLFVAILGCSDANRTVEMRSVMATSFGDINSSLFERVVVRPTHETRAQAEFVQLIVTNLSEKDATINPLIVSAFDPKSGKQVTWETLLDHKMLRLIPELDMDFDLQYKIEGEWRWEAGQVVRFVGFVNSYEENRRVGVFNEQREVFRTTGGGLDLRETDATVAWDEHEWIP